MDNFSIWRLDNTTKCRSRCIEQCICQQIHNIIQTLRADLLELKFVGKCTKEEAKSYTWTIIQNLLHPIKTIMWQSNVFK